MLGPKDIALLKLQFDAASDLTVTSKDLEVGDSISNNLVTLQNIDADNSLIKFSLSDGESSTDSFSFSLNWWDSNINYYDQWFDIQNSGDYIFRPKIGTFEPNVYSRYSHGKKHGDQQMSLYFEKVNNMTNEVEMRAIVHVTFDEELSAIKFDVDLDSLPGLTTHGYEVIAKWKVDNFDNNNTFYTDSNGLEMQKRVLNYRPTWNFTESLEKLNENVTGNYYPVNSAIVMMDTTGQKVLSVSNDRSQGGSSLEMGAIEFMQNRRIPARDYRGMGEWLNEVDANGNGIRVPASYYF